MSQGSQSHFIKPGSLLPKGHPQNGHAECFMARLRVECLNAEVFHNLADARLKLNLFRRYYNQERPHSALGYIPPAQFAEELRNKDR